jgi:hypothetical protein
MVGGVGGGESGLFNYILQIDKAERFKKIKNI